MLNRFEFLFRHSVPAFGQWTVWILLVFALYLAVLPFEPDVGVRHEVPATVFSLLPPSLLSAPWFYEMIRWVLIFGALGWMFHRSVPVTCWITCVAFTALWSLRVENSSHASQMFNVANVLLFIHAAWFHFYHAAIAEARENKAYRSTPLYPRWVFLLSVLYIGWFHTLGGISKLLYSGIDWGNGLALQIWIQLFGRDDSMLCDLIADNRTIAAFLQTTFLIVTTLAVLSVFNRWLRLIIGISLTCFYIGLLLVFEGFGFQFNLIIVVLFLLPFESLLNRTNRGIPSS